MSNLLKDKTSVGVIICRMQVPYLTESHKATINTVLDRHDRVVIFLGVGNEPISLKNPYTFYFRKQMIAGTFAEQLSEGGLELNIIPLPDMPDDNAAWVKQLDNLVGCFLSANETARLYGGRDSFIPYYVKDNGKFECTELAPNDYDSGTELRQLEAIKQPVYSRETSQAILWAINQITAKK